MAYKVILATGAIVTIDEAVSQKKDGSGLYLFNANGEQVASFADGQASAAYPANATVETPPAPPANPVGEE